MAATFAGFGSAEVHGVPVLVRRDDRFKTFRVTMLWQRPMDGGQAARALLPLLLQHGTAVHPDRPALARARERLYGATGGFGVGRHGETTVLRLSCDAVASAFLPDRPDQFGDVMSLLRQQLLQPVLRDPAKGPGVFERERAQALVEARAVFDDKALYARQQAVAAACRGEPYGVPDHGGEAAIAALAPDAPVRMLDDFLARGRRLVLLAGVLPDDPAAAVEPLLAALPTDPPAPLSPVTQPAQRTPGRTEEPAAMQQGKVVLVFRTAVPTTPAALCALQVTVGLWGGGPHSRLFREVRERRSLCYYASAGGDADKGLVLVQVGCDPAAVAEVVAETRAQLAELAAGRFTADELKTAIAAAQGPFRAIDDSLGSRLSFAADQWLRGFDQEPQDRIDGLLAVSADDVAAVASGLWLDHEYSLLPPATEGAA